eukprot:CAMPEP_0118927780 /NCGR_PEP_ID=MMETSP1169-20130426/5184_1 /TAXON_ID=36882 /ORGANISM="Pyramimonas obovata, Strain CCMP722" /LENGTH=228 /DNA_ID=CAMNT_0006869621 /DNA_START=110 /DNA_END=796 /DNA_ORIENTATION=-
MRVTGTTTMLFACVVFSVCTYARAEALSNVPELALREESSNAGPWFCHGIDCPKFTVVDKKEAYETRAYEATKWASTSVQGIKLDEAERIGFMRLFNYISGENMPASKIPMTAPVKNLITPGQGPFCGSNFTISFFVPYKYQENTPAPTSMDVSLTSEDAVQVYVRSFKGFAKEDKIVTEAAQLAEALDNDGVQYDPETYVFAGYDPPFRPVNRHNEIWFFNKPASSD